MGMLSRLLGIDAAVASTVQKTLKEAYDFLPGIPAPGSLDFEPMRPDPDGFLPIGLFRKRSNRGDNPQAFLNGEQLRIAVEQSRKLSVHNEYARNGLTNWQNYVVGTGFKTTAEPIDKENADEGLAKQVNEWLQRYAAITKRSEKEKEAFKRGKRDGDVFIRLFKKRVLEFRFVEPEHVGDWDGVTPFGIVTNPDDITDVKEYLVQYPDQSGYERVPADEMIHVKLNSDSGIKRGLPFLYPVFSILRKIESTNENAATNVAIMAAIAMIRKNPYKTKAAIDSNNSSTADYQAARPFSQAGGTDNYKQYRAGTILDADANTEYEFPANSINLGGVVQIKESLLQTAAAGMGMPEYMLTSDCSNGNLSTTQVGESPWVLGAQAEQHYWADVFGQGMYVDEADMGLTWRAIEYAVEEGQLAANVLTDFTLKVEGPNIEVRDKAAETDRNKVLADDGIISRDQWAAKEGHHKAHKSDKEMQDQKDAEAQATQSHELKLASAKGQAKQGQLKEGFDPDEPRDEDGKWTSGGSGGEVLPHGAAIRPHKGLEGMVGLFVPGKKAPISVGDDEADIRSMLDRSQLPNGKSGINAHIEAAVAKVAAKPSKGNDEAAQLGYKHGDKVKKSVLGVGGTMFTVSGTVKKTAGGHHVEMDAKSSGSNPVFGVNVKTGQRSKLDNSWVLAHDYDAQMANAKKS